MSKQVVLLLGGTGAVGKHVLRELLASDDFTRVVEAGRRVTSADVIADYKGKEKLSQKIIDFERLDESALKDENVDAVIITLGTTRAIAGSAEAFTRIDRTYPVETARAAKVSGKAQSLVYLSSIGANSKSSSLYTKSKGLTEEEISAIGYSTIVFRPGLLMNAERPEHRMMESIAVAIAGVLAHFTDAFQISVDHLAKSLVSAAALGADKLPASAQATVVSSSGGHPYHLIGNKGAMNMTTP